MSITYEQFLQQTGSKASDVKLAAPASTTAPATSQPTGGALSRGVSGYVSDTSGDIAQTGRDLLGTAKRTVANVGAAADAALRGESTPLAGAYNTVGAAVGGVSSAVGDVFKGGAKVLLNPEDEARVGGAVRDIGTAISETEPIKKLVANYALLDPEQKRQVDASLGFASFLADVAGFGPAKKAAGSAVSGVGDAAAGAKQTVELVAQGARDTAKSAKAAAGKTVRVVADPVSIMDRVARVTPSSAQKFTKLSGGESIGQYLTKRGVYGNVEDVTKQLYQRFTQTRTAADDGLAKLKGSFQPKPVETALDALVAREARVSSPGALSRDFKRVRDLQNKFRREGLTMPEINEVKRLYERNVRLDYAKQNLTTEVAKATNLDSAMREWQMSKADEMGFKNLREINKETQLARELADALGKEYSGKLGNNAVSLTDWILIAGGDPAALASLGLKKVFSSKSVMSAIARKLGGEATVGVPTPSFGAAAKPGLREFMMDKRPVPYKRR